MSFRYPQFCPLARATEVLGERWTLLIIRELMLGPVRFSELRRRLARVSPSILAKRIEGLEERGLVARRELPPPASVTVLELTEFGESLRPVVTALTRFGIQLLGPPEPDDQFEPDWIRLGLPAVGRTTPTPKISFSVTIADVKRDVVLEVRGSNDGTSVRDALDGEPLRTDVGIRAPAMVVMGLASGSLSTHAALAAEQVEVTGDLDQFSKFPELFDFGTPADRPHTTL